MSKTYATIVADPNWSYANFGAAMHGAARAHYKTSAVEAISSIPVGKWARKDSTLILWATWPKLDEAFQVLDAWGFSLVTGLPWVKTVPGKAELAKGIGFWWHGTSEVILVARRGKAKAPNYRDHVKPDGLLVGEQAQFYARRGPHSRKPPSLTEWVEAYLPGPYLELFARVDRPGWTCWGHDTGHHLSEAGVSPLEEVANAGPA